MIYPQTEKTTFNDTIISLRFCKGQTKDIFSDRYKKSRKQHIAVCGTWLPALPAGGDDGNRIDLWAFRILDDSPRNRMILHLEAIMLIKLL